MPYRANDHTAADPGLLEAGRDPDHGIASTITPAAATAAVIAVTVLHGMIHGYSIFLSPLNDQMRRFFSVDSISAITAMKTTYLAVYAAGNLLFGVLTNRVSARATLALGMILNGAAIAAFAAVGAEQIVLMHGLWALAALGGSVYHPIANVLITRLYPARKGMVLGVTGMGAAVGFACAPLATGILSNVAGLGWQQIALVFGGAGVLVGALAWRLIPPIPRATSERARSRAPRSTGKTAPLGRLVLAAVVAIACLREIAMWSVLDISDFFLTVVLADSTRTGFFLFLLYLPGIFVKPLVGVLSDAIGRKRLASAALVFYGLAIAATAAAGPLALIPIYLLMGVGQAATIPSIEAIVADSTTERNRGVVFGFFVTAGIGFGALGPFLSGAFLDALGGTAEGFQTLMIALGVLPLLGGIALSMLRLPSPESNPEAEAHDNAHGEAHGEARSGPASRAGARADTRS